MSRKESTTGSRPRLRALPLICALTLLAACHEIAEYSSGGVNGVHIIDVADMSLYGELDGFEGGRALCSVNNTTFLVACNTGQLSTVDSEELCVVRTQSVGLPFSSGYNSMIRANNGSIYLIGAYGQIIEYSTVSSVVKDEFSAGPCPVSLARSPGRDSIYVADLSDGMLREVGTLGNSITRQIELPAPASSISPFDDARDMILASSADGQCCYVNWAIPQLVDTEVEMSTDVAALADTAVACFTLPFYGSGYGAVVLMSGDLVHFEEYDMVSLTGDPLRVCSTYPVRMFYIASYLGDGITRVYALDAMTHDITGTLEVSGYPWDIVSHRSGQLIVVLTTGVQG